MPLQGRLVTASLTLGIHCSRLIPIRLGRDEDVENSRRGRCTISEITWLERDRWSTVPRGSRVGNHLSSCVAPLAARFEGQGADLVLVVSIRAEEAEHGAMISVPAPGTAVRLRIPPGTVTGRRFRLPRANAPAPDGFGDLKVMVEVVGLSAVSEG